ncbi:hypothetical protein DMC30DRAFT_444455 [Rhodotorula diobovata]|uniref:Proteophosphoglycan 5 n=1 Tax=Rhodotorula diobovata TaxID=5288 RepID=A0A5C5G4I3_9BASI|nr:hypothetical protein DMC30DRAFT_444455 [Rhodotorula diobovata]
MPSIKSCLAAFALAALAISPVAQATPVQASDLVRRTSQPSFYTNEAAVEKRSDESRKESSARVKRAKLAAAKKAKRASAVQEEGQSLLKRHIEEMHAREGVTKRDLERRAVFARALRRYRCANDRVCARAVTSPSDLPSNGAAVCNPVTHLCAVGCQDGYTLTGGVCVASVQTCGPNACGTTDNGIFLCSGNNQCTLICDTASGYVATAQNTCVSVISSADNCGAIGNVCPGSYNGVGEPSCRNRVCRLNCPYGTTLRKTMDGTALYCYGA